MSDSTASRRKSKTPLPRPRKPNDKPVRSEPASTSPPTDGGAGVTADTRCPRRQAGEALSRLPSLPARHAALGQRRSAARCTTSDRGKTPTAQLEKYLEQKDDLHAGRTPRVQGDGLTVRDLLNRFLTAKKTLVDAGELAARTFGDYKSVCEQISAAFGLTRLVDDLASDDFEKLRAGTAPALGPGGAGERDPAHSVVVFKYAYDAGLIELPIRYGPLFRRPTRKVLRKARNAKRASLFEADEIRRILAAAGLPLEAMVLLGINCGFGNADCGTLPLSALDLDGGWVDYPRPKTGIDRRCPLSAGDGRRRCARPSPVAPTPRTRTTRD